MTCSGYPTKYWYSPVANASGRVEYVETDEFLTVDGGHLYQQPTGSIYCDCTAMYQLVFYLNLLASNLHKDEDWQTFVVEKIVEAYQLIDESEAVFLILENPSLLHFRRMLLQVVLFIQEIFIKFLPTMVWRTLIILTLHLLQIYELPEAYRGTMILRLSYLIPYYIHI